MMGWHVSMGWGGWFGTGILMILFWGLVIWGIVALVRSMNAPGQGTPRSNGPEPPRMPEQILAERFARGEIGEEEYGRRREVLDASTRLLGAAPDTDKAPQPGRSTSS